MASPPTSIRKQILLVIQNTFAAVTTPVTFSTVALGPLGAEDQRKRFSLGIVAGKERFTDKFSYYDCTLPVAIELRITVNRDDPGSADLAEDLLLLVEQTVLANQTWGGLAIDTRLIQNEIDLTTYADRSVECVLFIEVHYRTSRSDPANPNPSF